MTNIKEINFVRTFLLKYRPRPTDIFGYLYVYYRKIDANKIKAKKLSHLILFKVGRTKNLPSKRVRI